MKYIRNNEGFSLVEIVASIVIISIIMISFFQFFTSNAKIASLNTDKLVTINLADATLAKLKSSTTFNSSVVTDLDFIELGIDPTELSPSDKKLYSYFIDVSEDDPTKMLPPRAIELNGKLYTIDYKPTQSTSEVHNSSFSESKLNFIRVVVIVYSPDGKTNGKSEGYVQID